MPLRMPPQVRQRLFSTSTRSRTALPSQFHSYNASAPQVSFNPASVPKLGRIGRWYLPTMALIAVGMIYLPTNSFLSYTSPPSRRAATMDTANRRIGFAIANALGEHNKKQSLTVAQEERNMMLLESYGGRTSLEDMERAISLNSEKATEPSERNRRLLEAYGEKNSLRDVEKALEVYEVQ